ncbi:hypothetical protein E2562_016900 [Oryza meyeriana var. granulata]|uniref:Uncharacterized protein n=1 Tax=Oryza meyeriana var. granulata TaxID=110450 RepID=A0A6G1DZH2_9ORYZ|nr:hypothetical protein E2562_016900 [Oryza meyeriana var. granulata]
MAKRFAVQLDLVGEIEGIRGVVEIGEEVLPITLRLCNGEEGQAVVVRAEVASVAHPLTRYKDGVGGAAA